MEKKRKKGKAEGNKAEKKRKKGEAEGNKEEKKRKKGEAEGIKEEKKQKKGEAERNKEEKKRKKGEAELGIVQYLMLLYHPSSHVSLYFRLAHIIPQTNDGFKSLLWLNFSQETR